MKRIGILSDTHSVDDPAIAIHFADVDEIWHAGDIGDLETYRRLETIAPVFRAVTGNIDGADLRPKIFVSGHSHILRVMPDPKYDLLHINPGAAGTKGWHHVRTLVRLTIDKGIPTDLEVIELANRQLK